MKPTSSSKAQPDEAGVLPPVGRFSCSSRKQHCTWTLNTAWLCYRRWRLLDALLILIPPRFLRSPLACPYSIRWHT